MTSEHDTDKPALVLFRHDLRLADNRALTAAAASGRPVVAAFVLDEESPGIRPLGGARRWWLHHSLKALADGLKRLGTPLVLRRGPMAETAAALVEDCGAGLVLWNRRYEPPAIAADRAMAAMLEDRGVAWQSFDGQLLHDPAALRTGAGTPYRVYTPFWRALAAEAEPRDPIDPPRRLRAPAAAIAGDALDDWALLPRQPDWAGGLRDTWTPGEAGAAARLTRFLDEAAQDYGRARDLPGREATSRLSPHLAHGEITPFQIWRAAREAGPRGGLETFRKEVVWREFCWHLLFHNPDLGSVNFNRAFDAFPWREDRDGLHRWQAGTTGYPIVDAGMRELWQTGWMHNRVRMVVASLLVKHLLVDWRAGEAWFWDTLVDADPASNTANWQWVAGSGADAAPYFRIFNPVLQGEKFDADGAYVRRFVPEIAALPDRVLHKPWEADADTLQRAGVKLPGRYPVPVVDHKQGRQRALRAYDRIKGDS
ncbi:DNA photolyase family protein [Aquibium sp. A9E412]|uniref:cryptochrome/photolyase family protein n=1 Tax=Aquibium sp. A9E412 TaxID=2976767 RepID=UPI0025B04EED|nr:deoxyribodipyrimidine photo-lyase [Aquibium sp. A9E412]MDN2565996.1 DNA photolyase family protein [Aquibium sp. A9E412]